MFNEKCLQELPAILPFKDILVAFLMEKDVLTQKDIVNPDRMTLHPDILWNVNS